MQVESMHFTLDEEQWEQDWSLMLSLAGQPGAALEQIHIFALAHILRRPIIVYGVKFIKSFRGENIGYARFQGSSRIAGLVYKFGLLQHVTLHWA